MTLGIVLFFGCFFFLFGQILLFSPLIHFKFPVPCRIWKMEGVDRDQIDKEMLPFLSVDARLDVRIIALQYFLGLTGEI